VQIEAELRAYYWLIPRHVVRRWVIITGGVLLVLLVTHALWLTLLAEMLVIGDTVPAPADAIIVLGGGSLGYREATAARLYAEGYAPHVLTSGGRLGLPGLPDELTFAELSALELANIGVPAEVVSRLNSTSSTCEEARTARDYAGQANVGHFIVVTDPFHTRRAAWIFDRIFADSATTVTVISADPSWFSSDNWWLDRRAATSVIFEYVKFVYLLVIVPCE